MIEIIKYTDKLRWNNFLKKMFISDFYHTLCYHLLDNFGEPILLHYSNGNISILFPLILRKIPETDFFDVTSVYGYSGPLININSYTVPLNLVKNFHNELDSIFKDLNIITAFSRLHPLIPIQEKLLKGYGDIISLNKTVSIDTSLDIDFQRKKFDKSLKHRLNQLRKKGFYVRKAKTYKEIKKFVEIYHETMDRVNARKSYYFDNKYFIKFLESDEFESFILLAIFNDEIVAGSLFTISNKIMQYHLSGTKNSYLRFSPMKLLIDEARLIASRRGIKFFHLGGGVGGKNDTLFEFKAAFSDQYHYFKIWKKILDKKIYDELVFKKFGKNIPSTNYFPIYRYEC